MLFNDFDMSTPILRPFLTILGLSFSLTIAAQPMPCEEPVEMVPLCADACIICDIDGFQGRHESGVVGEAPEDFCTFFVHNAQWIAFLAGSQDLTVEISVSNCEIGNGLEIAIYESLDCENFTLISNCFGGMTGTVGPGESAQVTVNQPLMIGQYYYIVMDGAFGDNCDWTLSVVNGNTEVAPLTTSGVISGDINVCPNITTDYFTSAEAGATIFEWTLNGQPIPSEGDSTSINWTADGIYELCVTASNVCDEAPPSCQNIIVTSFEPVMLEEKICAGDSLVVNDSIILTTAGDYSYNFITERGCDSLVFVSLETVAPTFTDLAFTICEGDSIFIGNSAFFANGQYSEVLMNNLGCDSTINLDLGIVICEIQGTVTETPVICNGESSGVLDFLVEDGTPPFDYSWAQLDGTPSGNGILTATNTLETIPNLPAGTYLITIADQFGNDLILIGEVEEPPVLSGDLLLSDYNGTNISCFEGSDGSMEVLAIGGASPYTYMWSNGETDVLQSGLSMGDYSVTVTDDFGCSLILNNALDQPTPFSFAAIFTDPNCNGFETGQIEVIGTEGGTPPYAYQLENNALNTSTVFPNLPEGDYTLIAEDANGCTDDTSATLVAPIIPMIELGDDLDILLADQVFLSLNANIPFSDLIINWSPSDGLSCTTCSEPIAMPYVPTTYQVLVESEDGCIAEDSIQIFITERRRVYFPNAFSPNDDGINDVFHAFGGPEVGQIVSMKIFSRWGALVFEQYDVLPNKAAFGWDGYFKGEQMQNGIYAWTAEVEFVDGVRIFYAGDLQIIL